MFAVGSKNTRKFDQKSVESVNILLPDGRGAKN